MDYPDNKEIKSKNLTQYFTCRIEGLNKIEFKIDNSKSLGSLDLKLFECRDKGNQLVANSNIEISPKLEWCSLEFEKIKDSAGKKYALELSAKKDFYPIASRGCLYPLHLLESKGQKISHTSLCIKTTCQKNHN